MYFLRSIWKIYHLPEFFDTDVVRGVRDNYQIWYCDLVLGCMKMSKSGFLLLRVYSGASPLLRTPGEANNKNPADVN